MPGRGLGEGCAWCCSPGLQSQVRQDTPVADSSIASHINMQKIVVSIHDGKQHDGMKLPIIVIAGAGSNRPLNSDLLAAHSSSAVREVFTSLRFRCLFGSTFLQFVASGTK